MSQPAPSMHKMHKKTAAVEISAGVERLLMVGISIVLLVPCFWQPRIVAGDLSSHAYNAWLATEVRAGHAPGLSIVTVWTNVLTDWFLELLARSVGSNLATQLVVAGAVSVFFWGAFFLLNVTSGRRPWMLCPLVGILTYGLVFQMGFLNFYLSVGLCLWILGLLWRPSRKNLSYAAPLVLLAVLAHALPLVWAVTVAGYLYVFRKLSATSRLLLPMLGIVGLMAAQQVLLARFPGRWSWSDIASLKGLTGLLGVDQAWIYDEKYLVVAAAMSLCLMILFMESADDMDFIEQPYLQLWILHLAAFVLLPSAIQLPQYQHVLAYIPERISLLVAIVFLILVGKANYGRGITRLSGVVAVAFFLFLYLDSMALNRAETEITRVVSEAPEGSRVIASIIDDGARVNGLGHVADRACIGHCYSYANYEPATAQFRIRATTEGGAASPSMQTVQEIERGQHIVTPAEAPLFAVCASDTEPGNIKLRQIGAGERTCASARVITFRPLQGIAGL